MLLSTSEGKYLCWVSMSIGVFEVSIHPEALRNTFFWTPCLCHNFRYKTGAPHRSAGQFFSRLAAPQWVFYLPVARLLHQNEGERCKRKGESEENWDRTKCKNIKTRRCRYLFHQNRMWSTTAPKLHSKQFILIYEQLTIQNKGTLYQCKNTRSHLYQYFWHSVTTNIWLLVQTLHGLFGRWNMFRRLLSTWTTSILRSWSRTSSSGLGNGTADLIKRRTGQDCAAAWGKQATIPGQYIMIINV